jgi:hypothetical protein
MPRRAETTLTVIVLIALPTVMYGGYSLLGLQGSGGLTEFQNTYFRAGHAHAGVLLVMTLAALNVSGRFGLPDKLIWMFGTLLIVGTLAQSGGMFLHMVLGAPGEWSVGGCGEAAEPGLPLIAPVSGGTRSPARHRLAGGGCLLWLAQPG